jgi:hypothetical protein
MSHSNPPSIQRNQTSVLIKSGIPTDMSMIVVSAPWFVTATVAERVEPEQKCCRPAIIAANPRDVYFNYRVLGTIPIAAENIYQVVIVPIVGFFHGRCSVPTISVVGI